MRRLRQVFGVPFLLILLMIAFAEGCKPLEDIDPNPGRDLELSDDTVMFDTVFTTQRLATRRLRIYNRNPRPVEIENVSFEQPNSPFTVYVNGVPAPSHGVRIEGNDSAYVLIQGKLPETGMDTALLILDRLFIKTKGRAEPNAAVIVARGQDAFYYDGEVLDCRTAPLVWTAQKPIVLFNSVLVPYGCTLTIQAGTHVHSFRNSNIIVQGTLIVEGTPEKRVLFTGTRLEPEYKLVPEQWGAIVFLDSSENNRIDWAVIENGLRGVQVHIPGPFADRADLTISNTLIRNMSDVGIYSFGGSITGYNNVIADCGTSGIAGLQGGLYRFWHNTVAYSGNTPFTRRNPTVVFADNYEDRSQGVIFTGDLSLNLANNLITGNQDEELLIGAKVNPGVFDTVNIRNNVVKSRGRKWMAKGNKSITSEPGFYRKLAYDFHPDSLQADHPAKRAGLSRELIPGADGFDSALSKDFYNQIRPMGADTVTVGAVQAF